MDKLFELYLPLKTIKNISYNTFLTTFLKALRAYKILKSYEDKSENSNPEK